MSPKHHPLHIVFRLGTAMHAPEAPIHLDALLAWSAVHASRLPDLTKQDDLPLEVSHAPNGAWVWKASQLLYRASNRQALPIIRRLDLDQCAADQGVRYESNLNVLTPGSGPFKSYSFRAPIIDVSEVHAWCVGYPEAIRTLLARITHIGKLSRIDCGRVQDTLVEDDDRPGEERWRLRTMPTEEPEYHATLSTLHAPYWKREERVEAWEPSARRIQATLDTIACA